MTRIVARIARIAGAAALVGAVATGLNLSRASIADEMIDPPGKSAKTGKAAKAKPARKEAKPPADPPRAAKPVARPPGVAQTPPAAGPPADGRATAPPASERPRVSDPRIEKLMEGARKAWESVGQPATGEANKPQGQPETAATAAEATDLEELKATFRRPPEARQPPKMDAVAALGARLFAETRLSADHKLSCATCHDPARSFTDGRARAVGRMPPASRRNTPSLWNAGFAKSFGWNGGVTTLQAQIRAEIEREGGMDATLEAAVVWLSRDETYVQAFDRAFGRSKALATDTLAAALAAYLKTLVAPPTRFDRWAEGDAQALSAIEIDGFRIFAGKGGCAACHNGWRFTDDAARSSARRSVKTPGLREALWSAPYMADGRARTLETAVAHATRKRGTGALTATERAVLVAFLKTLSNEERPVSNIQNR